MLKSIAVTALFTFCGVAAAADWPQFNGPSRDGISPETGLARQWPEAGPRVVWSVSLGDGFGGASVHGGEVYVLDRTEDATHDTLRCFDLATGNPVWHYSYPTQGRFQYPGSRSTPTVTDTHVYTVGAFGHVHCFDRKARNVAWAKHMKDFGGEPPRWGYGQSPLLIGNMLIIAPMSDSAGMIALNPNDGEVIWTSEPMGGSAYTSPVLTDIDGVKQLMLLTGAGITSVDPQTGKTLWTHGDYRVRNAIPSPTPIGDGRLFLTGAYGAGSVMLKVSRTDAGWKAEQLFHIEDGSMLHNAILHEGHLYANLNTNSNLGGRRRAGSPVSLACLDLDGNIVWKTGNEPNLDRGNLILADGMIISLGGQDGVLHLAEVSPDGYKPLASAKVFADPGENLWAPMSLANGKLLVRNQHELKCLDLVNP